GSAPDPPPPPPAPVPRRAATKAPPAVSLRLVTANRRLFAVRDMIRALRALVARHKGEVTAHVTVAEPLADRHLAALKDALKSVTGKDVTLDIAVEPAIIGGPKGNARRPPGQAS